MITEQELKQRCTPEIIKKMCELAEGFEFSDNMFFSFLQIKYNGINLQYQDVLMFPLLIYRAVEGWNKKYSNDNDFIFIGDDYIHYSKNLGDKFYELKNYQPNILTNAECAMFNCLLEVLG